MTDIVLGGRTFAPANFDRMTSLMECHVMTLVRKSGIDRIIPAPDDTEAAWLARLNAAVVDCGLMHELVAVYMLPIGTTERDWTRETCREIARFLEQLDTIEDRERMHELAMEVAFGFFVRGLESLKRFRSASEKLIASSPPSSPKTPTPLSTAAASTPAAGRRLFGWWRHSTSRDARKSRAGHSASS